MILAEGVEAVTMEGVAAAAGVSKGLGYAYFANADELIDALLARESAALDSRTARWMAEAVTFEDKLRASVHAWFDTVEERGLLLRRLLDARNHHRGARTQRSQRARTAEEFYGAMASAEFGIGHDQAVAAAAIFMAGLQGVVERWVVCGDDREFLEETFLTLVVAGLRALGAHGLDHADVAGDGQVAGQP